MSEALPTTNPVAPVGVNALAHAVWLPDAMRTLAHLEFSVEHKNTADVRRFCNELRRSAHLMRAKAYITVADDVELSYVQGDVAHCQALIEAALACSRGVGQLLERMKANPERFDPRGIIINSAA